MSRSLRDISLRSATSFGTYSFASCNTRRSRKYSSGTDPPSYGTRPTRRIQRTALRSYAVSSVPRSRRTYKTRPMFPMTKTWNGNVKTFPEFRSLLEGFLLQIGAGYLVDQAVVAGYRDICLGATVVGRTRAN